MSSVIVTSRRRRKVHDKEVARVLLLLPSATYRAPDFLTAASALGIEVVVGSEHRQAMAEAMGDRALMVPLGRPDAATAAILALHQRAPLDAVVAVDDQGVVVAAMAGRALGLPHNPPEAVARTRDKAAMRSALARAGVRQPEFRIITGHCRQPGCPGRGHRTALCGQTGGSVGQPWGDPGRHRGRAGGGGGPRAGHPRRGGRGSRRPLARRAFRRRHRDGHRGACSAAAGSRCWPCSTSLIPSMGPISRRPST